MLAIRLQRVGRKGYPVYRVAVQEAQRHPSSGRVVAYVGTYNPHTKESTIQNETAQKYLDNGAQPTPRVVKLLKDSGVKLPNWVVEADAKKQKSIKHQEKLRRNQTPEPVEAVEEVAVEEVVAEAPAEVAAEEVAVEEPAVEAAAEEIAEAAEETPAAEVEAPASEPETKE
ncbi:MAG: rpsP [Candidatus Saccharibacteria bacterium]|nr:rpsP [Candidatus Saccharibacteria bacterium]